ncbi:hypothetical protein Tco_1495454, partial [Tanacetum coccineum]
METRLKVLEHVEWCMPLVVVILEVNRIKDLVALHIWGKDYVMKPLLSLDILLSSIRFPYTVK